MKKTKKENPKIIRHEVFKKVRQQHLQDKLVDHILAVADSDKKKNDIEDTKYKP